MNPLAMSREVLTTLTPAYELATYAPPELRGIFAEWMAEIEREIAAFIKTRGTADPAEIAARFHLGTESVVTILRRLGQAVETQAASGAP